MSLEVEPCVTMHLALTTTATYAIVGSNVFWSALPKDPQPPFVRIVKTAFRPLASGLKGRRLPGEATITAISFAKSQQGASDLANAVGSDLIGYNGVMPNTSPVTSGAVHVAGIEPGSEENVVSEELLAKNIFAEARDYSVSYDQR